MLLGLVPFSSRRERKGEFAEIAVFVERACEREKNERKGDDILVTSELVESHILTGSFPVLRPEGQQMG